MCISVIAGVQCGGRFKESRMSALQAGKKLLPQKTDTHGYRGITLSCMAWVEGKLGISFPDYRVRSRSIVGRAPLYAKNHTIRSDHVIWSSDLRGLSLLWKPGALLWLQVV